MTESKQKEAPREKFENREFSPNDFPSLNLILLGVGVFGDQNSTRGVFKCFLIPFDFMKFWNCAGRARILNHA